MNATIYGERALKKRWLKRAAKCREELQRGPGLAGAVGRFLAAQRTVWGRQPLPAPAL